MAFATSLAQAVACTAGRRTNESAKAAVARSAGVSSKASAFAGAKASLTQGRAVRSARSARASVAVSAKLGQYLEEFLLENVKSNDTRQVMLAMSEASRAIAHKVRTASCDAIGCVNSFGDNQLAVDVLADKILFETLRFSNVCYAACSEEVPEPVDMNPDADLCVAFDPLDGSSVIDTNFAVGTIFGVYRGKALKNVTGRDLDAAGITVYGPRTTYCIAFKDVEGCHEFLLQDDGRWVHVKETTHIGEGKMFSPGNLRATFDNPAYEKLINHYLTEKYTLRYTGGMVPDVFQIIVKEKGVFTNITSPSSKAKLRMVFEAAPIGLLVEKAGGASSVEGVSVLDVPITEYDQRTQIIYGSKGEVAFAEQTLYGESKRFAEYAKATAAA